MLDSIFDFSSIITSTITLKTFLICTAVSLVLGILTAKAVQRSINAGAWS